MPAAQRMQMATAGVSTASFSPADIAGLQLWLEADALGLSDNDPVTTWTDSSGNGHAPTQSTSNRKPTYKTGIINGLPVLRFDGGGDGGNDWLEDTTGFDLPDAVTAFVVTDYNGVAVDRHAFEIGTGAYNSGFTMHLAANTNFMYTRVLDSGGNKDEGGAFTHGAPHVYVGRFNGTTITQFVDGTQVGTGTSAGAFANTLDHILIGGIGGAANPPVGNYVGDIGEIIIYNSALSTGNRNAVEDYLADKWGL